MSLSHCILPFSLLPFPRTISQTDFPTLIVTIALRHLTSNLSQGKAETRREREGKIILRLTDLSAACARGVFRCYVSFNFFLQFAHSCLRAHSKPHVEVDENSGYLMEGAGKQESPARPFGEKLALGFAEHFLSRSQT